MGNKLKRWLTGLLLGVVALSAVAEGPAAWTYSAKPWSQWILGAQLKPTFSLNLAAIAAGNYDPLTITRATSGTMFDSAGTLVTKSTDVARVDYDPATLAIKGLLIEEARTNSIRNNTMVGAVNGVLGSGGSLPTNWSKVGGAGLTVEVLGTGTSNGISYIEIKISGTVSSGTFLNFQFDAVTATAMSAGQSWTPSIFIAKTAGSFAGITAATLNSAAYNSTPTYLSEITTPLSWAAASSSLVRYAPSGGTTPASTAYGIAYAQIAYSGTPTLDITLRIGMPQLELGAFATSVIPTSTVAVTRAADIVSITGANFTSFWNATQGTIVVRAAQPTLTGGVPTLYSANSTASAFTERVLGFLNSSTPETRVTTGGVEQATLSLTGTITAGTQFAVAQAYKANDFASVKNGGTVFTDTSGTLPTVDRMEIGSISGLNLFNGWISNLTYYPTAVDAVTLTQLASDTMPTFAANDDVFWLTASAR